MSQSVLTPGCLHSPHGGSTASELCFSLLSVWARVHHGEVAAESVAVTALESDLESLVSACRLVKRRRTVVPFAFCPSKLRS